MKLIELSHIKAKDHFMKETSYFNLDLPEYIGFKDLLLSIDEVIGDKNYLDFMGATKPFELKDVNYSLTANKDGRFAWRNFEIIHPLIYVSLVNTICQKDNWKLIQEIGKNKNNLKIECCSAPVHSGTPGSDKQQQILSWWRSVEQKSLIYSLEYSHLIHTDVTDCYGSLYTHSIPWAVHGLDQAKMNKNNKKLLGNQIDKHIQACRYGQTNGISQGSVLMDFIAELVLSWIDGLIDEDLNECNDIKILRYRDDYRIFAHSDLQAEKALKSIGDNLRKVGMRLGVSKTFVCTNIVHGSIKPDKIAAINLQDTGVQNAKTLQKQLLRLHSFGLEHPNSGALKRLLSDFHNKLSKIRPRNQSDLEVQVAIATDIAFVSPSCFPAVAGILSFLIAGCEDKARKADLWLKVQRKLKKLPYSGYFEIWLQRIVIAQQSSCFFDSDEKLCQIAGKSIQGLWNNDWISNQRIKILLDKPNLLASDPALMSDKIEPSEIDIFTNHIFSG